MLINGVTLFEDNQDPRSPKYRLGARDARTTRSYQLRDCDESDRWAAMQALMGWSELKVGGEGERYISRTPPHAYPVGPTTRNPLQIPHLYVSELPAFEPIGATTEVADDGTPTNDCYRISCVYDTLPYRIETDDEHLATAGPLAGLPDEGFWLSTGGWIESRYISRQLDHGPRTITLPPSIVRFTQSIDPVAKAADVPEGFPFSQYRELREYTWYGVPVEAIPEQAMRTAANKLNDADFDGCTIGTLLYLSDRVHLYPAPLGGGFLADITYRMAYLPNFDPNTDIAMGWNSVLRVFQGKRYAWPISTDGSTPIDNTTRIFGLTSFADLFRPDQP